jgi:hypothetical protein
MRGPWVYLSGWNHDRYWDSGGRGKLLVQPIIRIRHARIPASVRDIFREPLYENGELKDLNSLISANSGWDLSSATGINNRGHWNGVFNGHSHAVVLTPIQRYNPHHGAEGKQDDDQDQ